MSWPRTIHKKYTEAEGVGADLSWGTGLLYSGPKISIGKLVILENQWYGSSLIAGRFKTLEDQVFQT
jgi:hypothetical protein